MYSSSKIYKKLSFDLPKDVERFTKLFENEDFEALHEHLKNIEPLKNKKGSLVVTSDIVDVFFGMAKYFITPLLVKSIKTIIDNFFKNSDMIVYLLNYWERNPKLFEESMTTKKNSWLLLVNLPSPKYKLYPKLKSEFYDDVDFTEKKRIKVVQTIWLQQIYRGLPQDVFLPVLRKLIDEIMDITTNPELYGDFLVGFVEKKVHYFGIFALEGVAKLMLEKNFSYPLFFDILYEKLPAMIALPSKEVQSFIFKLNVFMSSTHVPTYMVAAFAKRISRLCLQADVEQCNLLLTVLRNMFALHAVVQEMFHRDEPKDLKADPYVEGVPIKESNANESSLWEISAIARHWNSMIAKRVDFSEITVKSVMDTVPMQMVTNTELFQRAYQRGEQKVKTCPISHAPLKENPFLF